MSERGVYRVNYYVSGQPVSAFVCAESDAEASAFLGVRDGSASASRVAFPVEVVGVDKAHDALPEAPIFTAPPAPPKQFSDVELAKLREILARG